MGFDFSDRVVVITGAGKGLGREHARLFAKHGAKLLINDLGCDVNGSGDSSSVAETLAEELRANGGQAVANADSVATEDGAAAIIEAAMQAYGRIDVLVNNAGILRDKSFVKSGMEDFRAVHSTHVLGSAYCTHAAWPHMQQQGYGRVIFITSPTGLYGTFGQANYSAAKLALVGFMNSLKLEGAKYDIRVNCVSALGRTRMNEKLFPPGTEELFPAEAVSPAVVFLAGEQAPNGVVLTAGGDHFAVAQMRESPGVFLEDASPDSIKENWSQISDMSEAANHPELNLYMMQTYQSRF